MKQIAVLSGKGGTGKTSLVASFAHIAARRLPEKAVAVADCDVDAANLALLLPGEDGAPQPFDSGRRATIDPAHCTGCGLCIDECRFNALELDADNGKTVVKTLACEGCGVCEIVCPEEAVTLHPNRAGEWFVRTCGVGPLIHAELGIAQDNSGKLVAKVREEVKRHAESRGVRLVLLDGPPGVGCPVHATVTGVDLLVAVTEPSKSGAHDLERLLRLAEWFKLPALVVLNRDGLSKEGARAVEEVVERRGIPLIARIPFSTKVPQALARGLLPLSVPEAAPSIEQAWAAVEKRLALL